MMKRKLSRGDFLKYTAAGIGASALGVSGSSSLAENLKAMSSSFISTREGIPKFSRESPYYTLTPKGVKCQICPNNCILKEGQESICRTHEVRGEKLFTIAYGNPCSVHVDPIEKKPLYHYLPSTQSFSIATAGCNLACLNCQNWEISQVSPKETRNTELMPAQVVQSAVDNNCRSIAYTYSEPIAFYEYMFDTARLARARGIRNLFISNGYINEKPLRDLAVNLDAANINLKSFSDDTYARLNGGSLEPILRTLKILKEMKVWLEITNLVVPSWTDKPEMITEMCNWLVANGFENSPLHFSRFFPLYKLTGLPYTPENILIKAREIAMKAGMRYVYIGNVPGTPAEHTYCPGCKKMVVQRRGFTIAMNQIKNGKCGFCGTPISGVWG